MMERLATKKRLMMMMMLRSKSSSESSKKGFSESSASTKALTQRDGTEYDDERERLWRREANQRGFSAGTREMNM